MNYNIDDLLDKYEQGLCNADESQFVEAFLQEAEDQVFPIYDAFVEKEREIISALEVDNVLKNEHPERLLEKYEAGTVTASQSNLVESMMDDAEASMPAEYNAFVEIQRSYQSSLDVAEFVDELSTNTAENIDELVEQSVLSGHEAYQSFVTVERNRTSNINVAELISNHESGKQSEAEAKVVPMRSLASRWKSLAGIAAVLVVLLTAVVMFPTNTGDNGGYAMVNGEQIDDPEVAMKYALAILNKTSKELEKGTDNMKHLKDLRHTQIFK